MIWVKTEAMRTSIPASSQCRGSGVAAYFETVDTMTDLVGPGTRAVTPRRGITRSYVLDVVIPVHNEERDLPGSVYRLTSVPPVLRALLDADHRWRTTQVPMGPSPRQRSWRRSCPRCDVIHLDTKGRGGALQAAWMSSPASVLVYMDVDLSTELVGTDAACGAADLGPFRRRDRYPAVPVVTRRPRPEA